MELLLRLDENRECFDCGAECSDHPWISVQHAIVLCINCAGVHRSLGVDVSFVRSVKLDRILEREIELMKHGGNKAFREYCGAGKRADYFSSSADLYRRRLAAKAKGDSDLPTDLRVVTPPRSRLSQSNSHQKAQWAPNASRCELCMTKFSFARRRHHCRRCGRCVCDTCSPRECFRPIPPIYKPCRHCVNCVTPKYFDPRNSSSACPPPPKIKEKT